MRSSHRSHSSSGSSSANIAAPNPAIPNGDGDLTLPEYSGGIAAEVVPEKTLTTSDSASAWCTAFHARGIDCITFAEFKQVTGDSAHAYKDTLRLLAQQSKKICMECKVVSKRSDK